jgi:NADH:ubiquinone oxidoreductase subunit 2 (subunit N)
MDYITLYLIMATVFLLLINSLIVVSNMPTEKPVAQLSTDFDIAQPNSTETGQTDNFQNLSISVGTVSAAILATTLFLLVNFDNSMNSHLVLPVFDYFSSYGGENMGNSSTVTSLNLGLKTISSSEFDTNFGQDVRSYKIFSKFVLLLTFIVVISVKPYILKETSLLVLLSTAGILLMASSTNFISFYLALELISLASYILVSTTITEKTNNNIKTSKSEPVNVNELMNTKSKNVVYAETSIVAGLNYFLLSALSSGLLVLGISLIYYTTGELDFNSLARIFSSNSCAHYGVDLTNPQLPVQPAVGSGLGMCLVMAFVLFKLGASPFHYWVADVYEKVSIFVNYFLIVVGKLAMLFALMKLSFGMNLPLVENLLIVAAVSSLLVGSLAGLVQTKLRRLMAFSSINHVGYILLAYSFSLTKKEEQTESSLSDFNLSWKQENASHENLSVPGSIDNLMTLDLDQLPMIITEFSKLSIASLWLYVIVYSLSTLCFFAILSLAVENENGKNFVLTTNLSLQRLNTLAIFTPQRAAPQDVALKNNKEVSSPGTISPILLSTSLTITLLSLAGVPPLAGFVAKIAIFWQVLDSGNWLLATAAVLCSVIAAIYYLRIVAFISFYPKKLEKPINTTNTYTPAPAPVLSVTFLTALIIATITIGLVMFPVLNPSFIYLYMMTA